MTCIVVDGWIALGDEVVSKVQVAVRAAIAAVQEAAVPLVRKRELRMKRDRSSDQAFDVAALRPFCRCRTSVCVDEREAGCRG